MKYTFESFFLFLTSILLSIIIFYANVQGSRTQMGSTMRLSSRRTLFQTTECITAKLYATISLFLFLIEEVEMTDLLEQNIKPQLVWKYSLHTNWVHGPYKNAIWDRAADGLYFAVVPGGPFVKTRWILPQMMLVKKKNKPWGCLYGFVSAFKKKIVTKHAYIFIVLQHA